MASNSSKCLSWKVSPLFELVADTMNIPDFQRPGQLSWFNSFVKTTKRWGGRWDGGSAWGTHVNPWLIHVDVWQKPLRYCKVISLQLIKIYGGKKEIKTELKKKNNNKNKSLTNYIVCPLTSYLYTDYLSITQRKFYSLLKISLCRFRYDLDFQ